MSAPNARPGDDDATRSHEPRVSLGVLTGQAELDPHAARAIEHAAPDALPVSETFVSLQGEGKLTGVPSWFVRTSGCNLRCRWCDTPYASWNPEGTRRTIASLIEEARGHMAKGVRHAVLTGGEPMLFAALAPFSHALRDLGMHVTIETAGTIGVARDGGPHGVACDLLSLSPKLSTSTPLAGDPRDPSSTWRERHEQRRINVDALVGLLTRFPQRQLKFVACDVSDLGEIESLLGALQARGVVIDPADVLLMPEGTAAPSPSHKAWVASACVQRGWRYCTRLHIELYGSRRGT
jgi:7-carboxy-7-deazaguanine synthase